MSEAIKFWPADRITDDHTVEDRIHNAVLAEREKNAKILDSVRAKLISVSHRGRLNQIDDHVAYMFDQYAAKIRRGE